MLQGDSVSDRPDLALPPDERATSTASSTSPPGSGQSENVASSRLSRARYVARREVGSDTESPPGRPTKWT
ncbi:hypothetical protein NUW54_g7774 [Trametes sanguinea]|uniref:Uncharacterized protein n=1 Tax=Trametes sanguinea TaxID=158606 RepID=A0ACC1PII9_9APHY|nr:hypothetical protein NUW54_g7774 [Trametes sanguinea]